MTVKLRDKQAEVIDGNDMQIVRIVNNDTAICSCAEYKRYKACWHTLVALGEYNRQQEASKWQEI